ncbi:hypothetical protein WJX74_008322 [Apatococcus lobatus]|uniref:Uncharacterized protein n=1 Tax=Apatococcus lobatus TaxID=904363 RepID=A0AAW1QTK8_9CHLO
MSALSADVLRNVNLIEILMEDAEASGQVVTGLPENAATCWSEKQIRDFFGRDQSALGGLALSRTEEENPRLAVLCFPNAGSAEDMYTSEGTGRRKSPSPLLDWCQSNKSLCLAVQPPGRNLRLKEPCITSAQEMAKALFQVVAQKLVLQPYVVVAHSDECRGWDINDLVFTPALWATYQHLMRSDFQLFDSYTYQHAGEVPFSIPFTCFWGSRDKRVTQQMVLGWQRFTSSNFACHEISGHHLWPLEKEAKLDWLKQIADGLTSLKL